MSTFILIQMKIDDETRIDNNENITMSNIVRVYEAESEEVAIGKFVLDTRHIKAIKKLDIECYDLKELKKLN